MKLHAAWPPDSATYSQDRLFGFQSLLPNLGLRATAAGRIDRPAAAFAVTGVRVFPDRHGLNWGA